MKKILLATGLFILPLAVQAASGYIEGQVGYASIDDVDTETFTSVETGTVSGSLDYDSSIGYGLEIGIREFEQYNVLRVGLAWNRMKADLDSASINVTGGTVIDAISGTASASDLATVGLNFDNDIDVYSANFYYDIPVKMAFKPYLGIGIGVADSDNVEDNELALIGLVGGQYAISDDVNLGIKYQYIDVDSFTDTLGIEYKDTSTHMISATLGFNF